MLRRGVLWGSNCSWRMVVKRKKQVFGQSSEHIEREMEQLELALEDLLIGPAVSDVGVPDGDLEEASLEADDDAAEARRAAVAGSWTTRRVSDRNWTRPHANVHLGARYHRQRDADDRAAPDHLPKIIPLATREPSIRVPSECPVPSAGSQKNSAELSGLASCAG